MRGRVLGAMMRGRVLGAMMRGRVDEGYWGP